MLRKLFIVINLVFICQMAFGSNATQTHIISTISFEENLDAEKQNWLIVNDSVMGGRSTSEMEFKDNAAVFFGEVSLENNGGFVSVRRRLIDNETQGAQAVSIKLIGDGREYKLRFRLNGYLDGPAYELNIKTVKNEEMEFTLHSEQFVGVYRSRILNNFPKFEFKNAMQFELMLADKIEGSFNIKLINIAFIK